MGDTKKDLPTRECFMSSIPHGFSGDVNQFGEMACSATTPPTGERPIQPWSEGSGENFNSTPASIPKEKNTNVRVIFMDKQFETPLSSRSNSPHSESSFTTLFLSPKGELHSPPSSSSFASGLPLSGSLRLGMRAWPISGPLPTTGLENPTPFSFPPPCISFHCLYRLFRTPRKF